MLLEPFDALPQEAFRNIDFSAGDHLFRMGDQAHSIFFVHSGEVQLQRFSETGDLIVVHQAFRNQYFAEASIFSDLYHCDAVTNTDGQVTAIKKDMILKYMNADHGFSSKITQYFAHQVQDYRRLLELRSIKSANKRVLAGLQEGWHQGGGERSIKSFAAQLGLTHEATYRALGELVRQGHVIKKKRGEYQLR